MEASVGDEVVAHARHIGEHDRHGIITMIRHSDGSPPYVVQWEDGHEAVFYPSADCTIKHHEHNGHKN
jgi:hypothetical protein